MFLRDRLGLENETGTKIEGAERGASDLWENVSRERVAMLVGVTGLCVRVPLVLGLGFVVAMLGLDLGVLAISMAVLAVMVPIQSKVGGRVAVQVRQMPRGIVSRAVTSPVTLAMRFTASFIR
eukprot:m.109912 g.109912  ORF g.109912 m.109912 type:complete len:123 (+) comp16004_c1_seq3:96-464(+)